MGKFGIRTAGARQGESGRVQRRNQRQEIAEAGEEAEEEGMTLAACVTTHNEAETIGALVLGLQTLGLAAYVIDAGSTDGTGFIARQCGAYVEEHERIPIATGLLRGFDVALADGNSLIVQMDAGGSHDLADLPFLVSALASHDLALGSRFIPGSQYIGPLWRKVGSRLATAMCNQRLRTRFSDFTSGYRAFRAVALDKLEVELLKDKRLANGHFFQAQVLAHAWKMGLRVAEVPITYRAGRSSLSPGVAWEAVRGWARL
jgi:dolichol-phosphate mannosyltransferase